jgi:hypothetical protein
MSLLLELDDVELTLSRDAEVLYAEPACALVEEGGVTFGRAALAQARLKPQRANLQYLSRLNADPLPHPTKRCANHADLVYLHLLELKPLIDGPVTVAVPGSLNAEQLGTLLGIADEVGIEVSAFVDAAVLLAAGLDAIDASHMLELHLGRGCLTELAAGEGTIRRLRAQDLPGCGVSSCVDGWVNLIADRFVQQTRFDPLHAAHTEQQLYDQVYGWTTGRAATADFEVSVDMTDHVRRVALGTAAIEDKLAQRLRPIASHVPAGAGVLLAPRTARLPGIAAALAANGLRAVPVAKGTLTNSFAMHHGSGPLAVSRACAL